MVTSKKEFEKLLGEIKDSGEPGQFFFKEPESGAESWVVFKMIPGTTKAKIGLCEEAEPGIRNWTPESTN